MMSNIHQRGPNTVCPDFVSRVGCSPRLINISIQKPRPISSLSGGSCCRIAPVLTQVLPYLRIGGIALSAHDLPNTIKMIQWFEFGTLVKTHVAFNKPR